MNVDELNQSLAALIHFSDTQFSVSKVYHWCKKKQCSVCPIYWCCGEPQYQQIEAGYYQSAVREEPCSLSEVLLLCENTHGTEIAVRDGS